MNRAFFDIEKIYPLLLLLLAIFCGSSSSLLAQPAGFSDELVIDGWSQAVGVAFDDNGRMYVWEKGGKIWTVENGVKAAEPLIDISEEVGNWRDFGLVGFALDPNFLNNGHLYLWYVVDRHHLLNFGTASYNANASSEKEATIARLTRYTANATDNFNTINYNSRKILIGETKSSGPPILHESHGAGQIVFGTDGTLLVSMGDGASFTNPIDEGYYQANNPRSPQSRTWSIGIRNPYRITLKPESGSHNAQDGQPGTFFFGDVGWSTWEDLNVVDAAGQNFGWPIYEGISQKVGYNNPNYAMSEAEHAHPKIDWRHGADQARSFVNNQMQNIGSGAVAGQQFRGNSSTGGVWYSGDDFPEAYQNTYFHADYSAGWIRNFGFDNNNNPTFVKDFKLNAGAVVFLNTSPIENGLYYVRYPNQIRRITFTGNANKKPVVIIDTDKSYGTSPLRVKFDASQSFDPEYSPLSFRWDFGDNATSTITNPTVVFEAPSTAPTTYPIKLFVTDAQGATTEKTIPISLNNTPPVIVSTSIDNRNSFSAKNGANLNLSAIVTDTEHNGQLKYEWQTALFHDGHSHAEPIDNNPSTSTSLSPIECDGSTYWFRVTLKVTDPEGLYTTFQKDIFPDCPGLPQTINCASIPDQSITAGDIVLNATATSGLPVSTYLLEGPAIIFGNKIVSSGFPGKVTIRASQGGNEVYQPAMPIERSFNMVLPSNASCTAEGLVTRDIWANNNGNTINDIPISTTPTESSSLNKFDITSFTASNNAQRVRGFICPPQTGIYTFWVASDEDSQLWLSTNSNTENKKLIATVKGNTRQNQWNKYASQQSESILLVAGNQYYIEALMNSGGHLSVGWKLPDNSLDRPISGQYLSTWKGKNDQVITFFGIPDKITTDGAFTIGASASSGLPIDFSIVSGPATVAGTTITLTGQTGNVTVRASQAGNSEFNAAKTVDRRFEVIAPPTVPGIIINAPTNGSSFTENTIDIKYTLSGNLQFHNADHLLVTLDNQPSIDVHTLNGLYTLNNLSEGFHTVKIQLADGNHRPFNNSEATAVISFTIVPTEKEQSINFSSIANKLTTDSPFIIDATATSNLPVTFSIESGPATISGQTITLNGTVGTVVVKASQTGNEAYKAAPNQRQSFYVAEPAVEKQSQSIIFPAIANKNTRDTPFEVEAMASSNLPVTLSIESGPARVEGKIVTLDGVPGTVVIRASQAGNNQYNRAISFGRSFNVIEKVRQTQNINFEVIPNKIANDLPFTVNATAASGLPVAFSILSGPASVNGNIVTLDGVSGTVIIRASQAGNEDYEPATNNDRSFIVNPAPVEKINQLISFQSIPDKLTTDGPFSVNATATSGLPVALSILSGPAIITNNQVTLTGEIGTVVVRASQNGNAQYLPARIVDRPFKVTAPPTVTEPIAQIITFNSIADKSTTDGPFTVSASASSGLPVAFSILAGPAAINGNTITLTGQVGTVIIKASQAGNDNYLPATSIDRFFKVVALADNSEPVGQTITFNPIANKLTTDAPFTIAASATSGLPVSFSILTGPATVSGNTITLTGQVGTVIIKAGQAGNDDYLPATSIDRFFKVEAPTINPDPVAQLITFQSLEDKLTTDGAFTISASATSGLPVAFRILSGPATITNNRITLTGTVGTVVVNASQAGNAAYLPAQNVNRTFKVAAPIDNNVADTPKEYCELSSTFPWQDWIGQVIFNEIDNKTSKDIYELYETPTTTVNKGTTYDLVVKPDFSWTQWDEYIIVWIDFNGDGDFEDTNEAVLKGISLGGEPRQTIEGLSADILIPTNAKIGLTRMRVAMQRGSYPSACGTLEKGEVEDYILTIDGTEVSEDIEAEKLSQTINFPAIPDQLTTTASITLNATASSNLPIAYKILGGPASINGNILSLSGTEGTVVITAQQTGNAQYHPAQNINRAFKVTTPSVEEEDNGEEDNGEEDTSDSTPAEYCQAKGNSPWEAWISNVSFGTINHNSTKNGYGDFTNQTTTIQQGASYAISVSPDFSWTQWDEYINVWIDFNRDGDFEDVGEQVLSGVSRAGSPQSLPQIVDGTVSVPQNAKTGKTRMRVTMQQGQYADACDEFNLGEVEDYSINIVTPSGSRAKQVLTFSAYAVPSQLVNLEWISNSDDLTTHYQIERSTDNLTFYQLQKLTPDGTTSTANFYTATDESPLKGLAYYRIKQLNKDGSFKYSNAVEIERAHGLAAFYLFPNPVKDVVQLYLKPFIGKAAHIQIYNSFGQLVKESKLENIQAPTLSFSMENEQNGMYYLTIQPKGQKGIGRKFLLKRNY